MTSYLAGALWMFNCHSLLLSGDPYSSRAYLGKETPGSSGYPFNNFRGHSSSDPYPITYRDWSDKSIGHTS
jgi:hypothetical protein